MAMLNNQRVYTYINMRHVSHEIIHIKYHHITIYFLQAYSSIV